MKSVLTPMLIAKMALFVAEKRGLIFENKFAMTRDQSYSTVARCENKTGQSICFINDVYGYGTLCVGPHAVCFPTHALKLDLPAFSERYIQPMLGEIPVLQ